jgi:hypothetical protein
MKRSETIALLILLVGGGGLAWWWLSRPNLLLDSNVEAHGGKLLVEPDTPAGPTTSVVFTARPIGDDDLHFLRNKNGNQRLVLDSTRVTGDCFQDLSAATDLRWLSLMSCPIGDDGLAKLPPLARLELLDLDHTQITDAGLAHVAKLKGLRKLMICRNKQLSDACLEHLKGLEELTELDALDTRITEKGARELQKSLPRLTTVRVGIGEDGARCGVDI